MRIIAGTARSQNINVPKKGVRPTADRVREALFSILNSKIASASVLDLFAGSGALGLEALSRGARKCLFVDSSKESIKVIEKNLQIFSPSGAQTILRDVLRFLQHPPREPYDLIFMDPPYFKNEEERDWIQEVLLLESFPKYLHVEGILVVEAEKTYSFECPSAFELIDRRNYGGCALYFLALAN